jgi:uncharacterized protein YcfL
MNNKYNNKPFWSKIIMIVMIFLIVLATLPMQTALAADSGFTAPSSFSKSALTNPGNAYVSDNVYAQTNGNNKSAEYGNFGFLIPTGATINLVEVSIESYGTKNWKVAVSKDNGATYSAYITIINTAVDTVTVTTGPGTLWGLTGWTPDSLTNAKFKVKIASAAGGNSKTAYLDQLMVRVTYTPANATPTTLVVTTPPSGIYGGTTNLQATLTTNGSPLSGKTITFSLDGFAVGTAVTGANGVANLSNVNLTTGLANTLLNVGNYVVSATFAGDGNYAYSSDTDTQTVNPRPITVMADPKTKVYGSNDPALTSQITSGSLVGSDAFSGSLTRTTGENVGTYAITQGTLGISSNYSITYVSANLTITPLGLTITADNKAIHTGNSDPTFTFSTSRFVGTDTLITGPICNVSDPHTTAGTYFIVCSGADAGSNYSISYVNGTLTVTDKVILTVTANPQTITYGDPQPSFTFTYGTFDVGDDQSMIDTPPTCTVADPHTNAGSYSAITCGGGLDNKYEFSYFSGTLTINPRVVTVKANPISKTYGDTDPVFTYQVTIGSLVSGDTFSGVLSRVAGENVGTYAIIQGTLTLGANYTITYAGDNLAISQASLTVTADDKIMALGGSDPVFTLTYDGFVNGDNAIMIDTPPTCGVLVAHTTLGTYPITCSGGTDNNYVFSFVDGTLTVALNQIGVTIGVNSPSYYALSASQSTVDTYPLSNGPVTVESTNALNLLAAERVIFSVNGVGTSYSELMGLPQTQVATSYLFPWYNNLQLNSQLRFGNVGSSSTVVSIKIHGVTQATTYTLLPGESTTATFPISDGPVEVVSDGQNIIAAERVIFSVNGVGTSYSELMGLPQTQLATSYLFPWYNNLQLNAQLRFGNVGSSSTVVSIKIHGVTQPTTYTLLPGESTTTTFPVSDGPVEVVSDGQNIIAAERVIFSVNGVGTSYSELMGLPQTKLATSYLFPWYNNLQLNAQLRFGNVGSSSTVVSIKIHGVTQPTTYTLLPGESTIATFPVSDGPVEVVSDGQNIIAAERVIFAVNNTATSYSELMGLPQTQLAPSYLFPWYNNLQLNAQLRFAVP